MDSNIYTIDAAGKPLGRLASEVVKILRGKNGPAFERNIAPKVKVTVINAKQVKLSGRKLDDKYYKHYTGFPGGMKYEHFRDVAEKKGYAEPILHAIHGMLPGNKLRPIMLKNLTITE